MINIINRVADYLTGRGTLASSMGLLALYAFVVIYGGFE